MDAREQGKSEIDCRVSNQLKVADVLLLRHCHCPIERRDSCDPWARYKCHLDCGAPDWDRRHCGARAGWEGGVRDADGFCPHHLRRVFLILVLVLALVRILVLIRVLVLTVLRS